MADKITAEELRSQQTDFVIVDVRESDELESGKIESSIHMPLGLIIRNTKKK
jgi:rhodanese-related sulfurtransferase